MDRGMVSEENIESLQSCGARYLVGTPKSMLRKFEHELIDKDWQEVQPGVEVKLCQRPMARRKAVSCAAPKAEKTKRRQYSTGSSRDWKQDLASSNNRLNQEGSGTGRRQTAGSVDCLRETAGLHRCLILPRRSREQACINALRSASQSTKTAMSGSLPPAAATFCAPTGQRKIPGRYGRPTFTDSGGRRL